VPLWFSVVSAVATGDLGAPDVLVADPVEQAVDFEPPRFLRMVRVRFRLRSEDPNLLNWVASEWHSPGDTAVRTAAIWATGGGRVQGQPFGVWKKLIDWRCW